MREYNTQRKISALFSTIPAKINIFVGRNNAGKSSALEALALALSAKNGFVDALGEDLVARIMNRRLPKTWKKGLAMQKYFIKLGSILIPSR